MQNGVWDGGRGPEQIVSAARVSMLTHWAPFLADCSYWGELTPTHIFAGPHDSHRMYGHLWWTNRAKLAVGRAVPEEAFFMWGWGGQTCIVIPSSNMVIVRLGIGNEQAVNANNRNGEFFQELCRRITGES